MKVVKFLVAFAVLLIFMTGNCFAFDGVIGTYDPESLADMKKNPQNYISCGGLGTDVGAYVYKNSIDVQKYAPPEYVIAFKEVYRIVHRDKTETVKYVMERYKYNFKEKKIYLEIKYENGRTEWELLDTNSLKEGPVGKRTILAAGEIAFYLAYNISFFDKPLTDFAQNFINRNS